MSAPVLTPNFEPVEVAGSVNGAEIVYDLCDRLAEKLLSSDSLRESDAYSAYSVRLRCDLQLTDVCPVAVSAEIQVGSIDPRRPSQQIALDVPTVEADAVRARSGSLPANLERFLSDGAGCGPAKALVCAPWQARQGLSWLCNRQRRVRQGRQ